MYSTVNKLCLTIIITLPLSGCLELNRQDNTATTKTVETVGVKDGNPIQITETTTEKTIAESQVQAGVDVSKALSAGFAAIRGDFLKVIESMKPAEAKTTGMDLTTSSALGGAASLGLLAIREYFARKQAQKEAEEEYARANANHDRAEAYAKELEPTVAKTITMPS